MCQKSILLIACLLLASCSPRNVLSRRLASDLIQLSDAFKSAQSLTLQTGIVSNQTYTAPEYLVLQHRGWITVSPAPCPAGLTPAPCWDILLAPSGVETLRLLLSTQEVSKPTFTIPLARRELIDITGISKQGSAASVEFTWRWVPLNEVGAALYSGDQRYKSTVGFRDYDDGWRVVLGSPRTEQPLEDALKNPEPIF